MTIYTTNPSRQTPKQLARSAGFSLVEILVAISLMAIMTVAVAPQLKYLVNFESGMQTQNLLSELQSGFAAAYQANVNAIEANPNAVLSFPSGVVAQATASGTGRCTATAATFAPWSDYTGHAAGSLATDGYGAPLCVFISPQMAVTLNSVPLYYHVVAFVSAGPNRVLDAGTGLNPVTGNLTLAGDDTGITFNGQSFVLGQYNQTVVKMQNIAQALSAYYLMRYQADPTRSSSIDYWSAGAGSANFTRWDSSNTTPPNQLPYVSTAPPQSMYTTGAPTEVATVLALSQNDVTDGFGNIMRFENATSNVRSPDSGGANSPMTFPPYTALISTTLPGGSLLSQAVVGVNN
jgi:prepilin-type N-terminal cleavage/methylation domain-containing protein